MQLMNIHLGCNPTGTYVPACPTESSGAYFQVNTPGIALRRASCMKSGESTATCLGLTDLNEEGKPGLHKKRGGNQVHFVRRQDVLDAQEFTVFALATWQAKQSLRGAELSQNGAASQFPTSTDSGSSTDTAQQQPASGKPQI